MEERARTSTRRRVSRAAAALNNREAMRLIRSAMRLVEEAPESLQLRSRFEAEAVSATLRAIPRPLSREATRAIERMARWIIAECADLIEGVPVNDAQRVSAALRAVQERRLAGGKNLRTASPLVELIGSWRESDGILYRDGRAVSIKSTAPRLVRLAAGVEVQPLNAPESGRRTADAALAALAGLMWIKSNRTAFFVTHGLMAAGAAAIGVSTFAFEAGLIDGLAWMIATGAGLYICYTPYNAVLFERLIAASKRIGTAGFLIYLADTFGYVGSVALLLVKNFTALELDWLSFFKAGAYVCSGVSLAMVAASAVYFRPRLPA